MPKIQNWSRTQSRSATDVADSGGIVREWEHDDTGDTASVRFVPATAESPRCNYEVWFNGEREREDGSLRRAESVVTRRLQRNHDGFADTATVPDEVAASEH